MLFHKIENMNTDVCMGVVYEGAFKCTLRKPIRYPVGCNLLHQNAEFKTINNIKNMTI